MASFDTGIAMRNEPWFGSLIGGYGSRRKVSQHRKTRVAARAQDSYTMNAQALLSKGQWHQLHTGRVQWHQLQLACGQGRAVVLVSHHDHYRSLNRSKKKNSN